MVGHLLSQVIGIMGFLCRPRFMNPLDIAPSGIPVIVESGSAQLHCAEGVSIREMQAMGLFVARRWLEVQSTFPGWRIDSAKTLAENRLQF
jgi:hypothetical protein